MRTAVVLIWISQSTDFPPADSTFNPFMMKKNSICGNCCPQPPAFLLCRGLRESLSTSTLSTGTYSMCTT